jgi:hypothetical protein
MSFYHNKRVILITTKLLQHFGHELDPVNWQPGEDSDLVNACTNMECRNRFTLFTPFPHNYSADRIWRMMNIESFEGFHFNESMEYQEVKNRVLRIRNKNLYCGCH